MVEWGGWRVGASWGLLCGTASGWCGAPWWGVGVLVLAALHEVVVGCWYLHSMWVCLCWVALVWWVVSRALGAA